MKMTLLQRNAARWAVAKITRATELGKVAKKLVAQKSRYQAVELKTGVPWFVIAAIHQRESSQDFSRSLAQGDPWNKKSTHVPKGRGPFSSWEAAAVDALVDCHPHLGKRKDWSTGPIVMTALEEYNGLGYYNRNIPSPYVWAGTDQYVRGKYVADGKFSATAVDKQLGCAGMILAMKELDPSISFGKPVAKIPDAPLPEPPKQEPIVLKEQTALGRFFDVLLSIFKRK